jgi:hypothetical protein
MNRTIEAYAKTNLHRALVRAGVKPLALITDAALVASTAEDPRDDPRFWIADEHPGEKPPRDRLVLMDSPGRFTHDGTKAMGDVLEAIEASGNLGIRRLLDLFEAEEDDVDDNEDEEGDDA